MDDTQQNEALELLELMRLRVDLEVAEISTDRPLTQEMREEAAALQEWSRRARTLCEDCAKMPSPARAALDSTPM
jgi:hypothetical protein